MSEALETLRNNLGKLRGRDQDFAQDLLDQAQTTRGLSPKQWPWVDKLIARATMTLEDVGPVEGIVHLLTGRGTRARITIRASDTLTVRLSIAGERSTQPGSIPVTSADKGFDNRKFYGRISLDGKFVPGRDANSEVLPAIVGLLRALAQDPAGTAAKHGHETGECCFCSLELSDPKSIEVGYGPQCAKKYGLPWGTRA